MAWNSFFIPVDMVWLILIRWTWFWPKIMILTQNILKFIFYLGQHGLTCIAQWDRFSQKIIVLTRNSLKLILYPSWHGLTRIVTPHLTSKILFALGLPVHPNPGLPPRSPSRVCSWQSRMTPKRVLLVKVSVHL